ncbi:MAG: hypothetical protein NVSMB6_29850 [Burkholderiaceae bacterium]
MARAIGTRENVAVRLATKKESYSVGVSLEYLRQHVQNQWAPKQGKRQGKQD